MSEDAEICANVRNLSGVDLSSGPDDVHIVAGVRGFAEAFDYWYIRVVRNAVPDYRRLIIARVNPFIRRIELEGLPPEAVASKLVEDWNSRNFVTAGGWALEEMAVAASSDAQKSGAEGIDLQRHEALTGEYHLYVLKSGTVTRNSDIMGALKRNARQAEKLLRQGRGTTRVTANYASAAGKTSSTFEDGVRRPSSAEFWSDMFGLPEEEAIELALAMAAEAGRLIRRDAEEHIEALKLLVATYVRDPNNHGQVDWDFIAQRTMRPQEKWKQEDERRHELALRVLSETGYKVARRKDKRAARVAEAAAELEGLSLKDLPQELVTDGQEGTSEQLEL